MKIEVDFKVDHAIEQQIQRSGFSVVRSGTYLRVTVGGHMLAREQAVVLLTPTVAREADHGDAKEREAPEGRSGEAGSANP